MKIKIVCVGKIKEKYWNEAIKEYMKRLNAYATMEIVEVADEKTPDKASDALEVQIKDKEGKRILTKIHPDDYVALLDLGGKMMSSEELSTFIADYMMQAKRALVFVIGGSLGVSQEVRNRADVRICFSKMTFPHQMMRVILLEQVYRAFKIMKNEPYHK